MLVFDGTSVTGRGNGRELRCVVVVVRGCGVGGVGVVDRGGGLLEAVGSSSEAHEGQKQAEEEGQE